MITIIFLILRKQVKNSYKQDKYKNRQNYYFIKNEINQKIPKKMLEKVHKVQKMYKVGNCNLDDQRFE